jgi:hypothetical protein
MVRDQMTRRQLLFAALTPLLAGAARELPTAYTDSRRQVWRIVNYHPGADMLAAFEQDRALGGWCVVSAPDGPWDALPDLMRRIEETL